MALLSPLDRDLDAWLPHGHPLDGKVREWLGAMRDKLAELDTGAVAGRVNVKDYGGRGKKETSTGNMTAGLAVVSGTESAKFPVGTWLAIDGAGARSTTGSITATSQTLTVDDATGFEEGVILRIAGAGFAGDDWYPEVTIVNGLTITIDGAAITTVVGAVVDLVEPTTLPAKLLGRVVSHSGPSALTLDRVALTSVAGAAMSTDNYRAFKAAIDAMNAPVVPGGNFASRHGTVLYIPPGEDDPVNGWGAYMCHRPIRIKRHMVMTGDVPNGALGTEGTAVLEYPAGTRCGILIESSGGVRTTGGNASGATIQNVRGNGGAEFDSPVDTPSLFGQGHPKIRRPATVVTKGTIRIPTTARINDYARVLVCVQAGTTAGASVTDWNSEPDWNANSFLGRIITDGTAKWMIANSNFIDVLTTCQIYDALGVGWYGSALQWAASSPDIANLGTVRNIQGWFNGAGVLVIGQDANQIVFIGGNAFGNYGYGLDEESFLGNTFIGFHCQDNIRGCLRLLNGTFINCYAEGAQGPVILGTNVTWIDGVRGAASMDGFNDAGPGGRGPVWTPNTVVLNNTCIYPTVDNGYFYWTQSGGTTGAVEPTWPLGRSRRVAGDGDVAWFAGGPSAFHTQSVYEARSVMTPRQIQRGHGDGKLIDSWPGGRLTRDDEYWAIVDNEDGTWLQAAWTWIHEMSGPGTHGLAWNRAFSNHGYGARPFLFLGPRAADRDFDGQLALPDGFVIGDRSVSPATFGTTVRAGRMVGFLDAIPTSGAFIRNDWFHFHNPVAAGWIGAVCVTSGTPGTWKRFGAIEP
jgi:hypothetical protein